MTQEELKAYILSSITRNKDFWEPKIEAFFKENPDVTRETMDAFFGAWVDTMRRESDVFRTNYYKNKFGDNYLEDIPLEVLLSDNETRLFDFSRRQQGLIPLEEVSLAWEEVATAFDKL